MSAFERKADIIQGKADIGNRLCGWRRNRCGWWPPLPPGL